MAGKERRARARAEVGKKAPADLRWWNKPDPHQAVWDNYKRIGRRTSRVRAFDTYYAALYDDLEYATAVQGIGAIGEFTPQTMCTNIVRRQVDTFVAKLSKNRPVPMALTTAGNYGQQRRAKAIGTFFEGVLDQVDYWPTRTLRLRDCGVVGSGFALNYRVGRRMVHDRIFKKEIRVCPIDAEKGKPRSLYIGRLVDKLVLAERFPEHAEKIYEAEADCGEVASTARYEEDVEHLCLLIEAWHLPSAPGAKDGAHVVTISNATLANGVYTRDTFPLSKIDYSPPQAGYFGSGLAQQLEGLQYEVNAVGLRLQERHYLMGTYVLVEDGAEVTYETIDNGTLTEVRYRGTQPSFQNPPAAHSDLFNWWRELRTTMPAEITGLSNFATRSEKPAGIIAAKAIRMVSDSDLENLTPQGRADEQDVINTCWQFFDLAEEIYSETGKDPEDKDAKKAEPYMVKVEHRAHGQTVLQDIDYAKVRIDRENFKLRTFPTNFLRGTPEEQMQSVNEMIEAGFLSQDEALVLLDFPDLQRVLNLRGAARHVIERTLEKILDAETEEQAKAAYVYPEPAMNLELCKALAIMTYLNEKLNGAEEWKLKLVMQFSLDATAELLGDQGQAADAAAAGELPPEGMPNEPIPPVDPALAGMPPGELYAPPEEPLLPEGAVPPEMIPAGPMV